MYKLGAILMAWIELFLIVATISPVFRCEVIASHPSPGTSTSTSTSTSSTSGTGASTERQSKHGHGAKWAISGNGGGQSSGTNANNNNHRASNKVKRRGKSGPLLRYNASSGVGLYVLPAPGDGEAINVVDPVWAAIPMPSKSYYGFPPPSNKRKWKIAQLQASRGEQLLLARMLESVRSPMDVIYNDAHFKWIHRVVEQHKSKADFFDNMDKLEGEGRHSGDDFRRAPITLLGYNTFEKGDFEGDIKSFKDLGPAELIRNKDRARLPRKIVGVGMMNENWGYLSTYFLNRTTMWGKGYLNRNDPGYTDNPFDDKFKYPLEWIRDFLDDPNLVMLAVNQHHNISHPKVLSLPLGIQRTPHAHWRSIYRSAQKSLKKKHLLFTAGSDFAFRPYIRQCIAGHMNASDFVLGGKLSVDAFKDKLFQSMFILTMPGLGYDTYRHWETLYSGSIPVSERGMGMDRTFYRLPVLLVDDFATITAPLLRQAYVEALYRADEWEYDRLTKSYWERLLYAVADSASIEPMLKKHPMHAEDLNFTRPLVPFDCAAMGGCGPGTKRTPKVSCAIDPSVLGPNYRWRWEI